MKLDNRDIQSTGNFFTGEIDHDEIKHIKVVGKGTYGTVYKAKWRDYFVAVKYIEAETEQSAFRIELRQLSRVSHKNIVALYGACTKEPHVCLVMEYAEGGSLYNVLHGRPRITYNAAHAMSWARQCAEGVAYLHAMRPKPLIHRDLKPPNLLLVDQGRTLKICDFGTVTDLATLMTNNRGSAAWMAPEVFEGSTYAEKCDVFSWGIILWEMITREQPYKNIGSAYGVMWKVHSGIRPPLIEGCPKPIEELMTSCWDSLPENRPSMDYVVKVMHILCDFFPGADEPLDYSNIEEVYDTVNRDILDTNQTNDLTSQTQDSRSSLAMTPISSLPIQRQQPLQSRDEIESSIREFSRLWPSRAQTEQHTSIGFSDSRNCTVESGDIKNDNYLKRNGALIAGGVPLPPLTLKTEPNAWDLPSITVEHETPNSQSNERLPSTETRSTAIASSSNNARTLLGNVLNTTNPTTYKNSPKTTTTTTRDNFDESNEANGGADNDDLSSDQLHLMLEPHLRPKPPDPNSDLSKEIYEEHNQLAKEYLKIHTEIAYVTKHRDEILSRMDAKERQERLEICNKLMEKEELMQFQANLKRQLELIRLNTRPNVTVAAPTPSTTPRTPFNRQNSNTSTNEDGWILVQKPPNESDA
ncbi:mitogen-activated protein kinase kinase kinase 7 isoform X2 [Contarinia nasturtii]|uniref:mitogen-activated protein kinase kinase kinase 7 isoform X2 n=1 Tax=Contarinia nasturtii TaxID=265458 RepID=UPI0012D4913D|nr:mitogen-activated protein kinase kinase kinase 7 isoform X2 [Contarinia nasturtii]